MFKPNLFSKNILFLILLTHLEYLAQAKKIPQSAYLKPILDTTDPKTLSSQKPYLQGSLSILRSFIINKKISPIPLNLRAGNFFDPKNLPPKDTTNQWYKIPQWLAGVWHRKYEIILSQNNLLLPTKQTISQTDYHMGVQKDNRGNIWTLYQIPHIANIDSDKESVTNVTSSLKILANKYNKLIIKTRSFQIYVDKTTNKISKVKQNEIISIYTPLNSKQFQSLSRVDWYNEQGFFISSDERISTQDKIKDFEITNNLDSGFDVKTNLSKLFAKIGLVSLLPLKDPPPKKDPNLKLKTQIKKYKEPIPNYEILNGSNLIGNQIKVIHQGPNNDPRICKPLPYKENKPKCDNPKKVEDSNNTKQQNSPQTQTLTY